VEFRLICICAQLCGALLTISVHQSSSLLSPAVTPAVTAFNIDAVITATVCQMPTLMLLLNAVAISSGARLQLRLRIS